MRTANKPSLVVLSGVVLMLAACSQVAITGRSQFVLVPDSLVNSMSYQSYSQFLAGHKRSNNAEQTQMVERVGGRISKAVHEYCDEHNCWQQLQGYKWEFNLIEDPNVNAWAMPGGKVVVYTGLLPVAQNEAGLAVVMGHEIAHAFARHGAERMTQGLLFEFGGIALSEALKSRPDATQELFMKSYGLGAQIGVLLPYSRLHESEADRLGLIFMAMAGYNPNEAITFWERMAAKNQKGLPTPEILSTHPAGATRIRNIRNLIPEAMEFYRPQ
jgi:predicted Zn-dependent protease